MSPAMRSCTGICGLAIVAAAFLMSSSMPSGAADCSANAGPGVDWTDCDKKLLILSGSDFNAAMLAEADFTSTDLRNTNLLMANLEKATLVRASLAGARAEGANFNRIEAYRTNFSQIHARGATFVSSELQRSNFSGAVLTNADFTKADLGRADFSGAEMTGTRFHLANLSRADLSKTSFTGPLDFADSFMFLTRIEGMDLSAATGLEQWQVDMSCGDSATKLPARLSPPGNWPCQFD